MNKFEFNINTLVDALLKAFWDAEKPAVTLNYLFFRFEDDLLSIIDNLFF